MLIPVRSTQFKRDVKRMQRRGKDLTKLRQPLAMLARQVPLPTRYRDHLLRGNWQRYREFHIEPNWLLIYRVVGAELQLVRTGSHADLFNE